jgi:hypothetical protein
VIYSFKQLLYRIAAPVSRPVYSGLGSILTFHRVRDAAPPVRVGWVHEIEVTTRFLEQVVSYLRKKGYSIVSLDELHD